MPLRQSSFGPFLREATNVASLLLVRGGGVAATFLMSFLIVRHFGVEANGLFQVALGYAMIAAAVARLGQEQLALREIAALKGAGLPVEARRKVLVSITLTFPAAILTAIIVALIAYIWGASSGRITILIAPAVAFMAWLWILTEALRGWQQVTIAIFWQASFVPIAFVISFLPINAMGLLTTDRLPVLYSACAFIAFGGAIWSWRRAMHNADPGNHAPAAIPQWRPVLDTARAGGTFWALAILTNLAGWIDLLVLYAVADATLVGIFQPIIRTGGLIAVAINIATAGLVANLALLYASSRLAEFVRLARFYAITISLCSMVSGAALLFFAPDIMALWGPEIAPYHREFSLYVIIQVVQAFFIIGPLSAPIMGLERAMVFVQIVNLPLKMVAVAIGYTLGGLAGVIAGLGFCVILSVGWIIILFFRQLANKGIRWQTVITGQP